MGMFARFVGIEMNKILIRKKFYLLLVIELFFTAVTVLFTSVNGFAILGFNFDLPSIPYIILNALLIFIMPLVIFMLCADLFTNELETGMLKAVLLRPISRFMAFVSKIAAVELYVLLHLMTVCAIILAIKIVLGSPADMPALIAAYAISVLPMLAFTAFAALISLLVGNSSLAMFVSMILYFVMQGLSVVSAPVGAVFFTSHINVYRMIITGTPPSALPNTLLLILSYIVLMSVAAFWLFDHKEL
ncbi:MAG: ABC transporter permease subunit [Clostridiales bacterium]|jgi:ABC-2 type transport system permease protein|nr:ABC transporter permease subunit [Clostridiales bacterium]